VTKPRLGFLGVGWIGRNRMEAMLGEAVEAAAIADPSPDCVKEARQLAPGAEVVGGLEDMLRLGLDGVVIATPSALHAEQSVRALEVGAAVFCQKPLGRTQSEVRRVTDAARGADRLLGVDMSYRETDAMVRVAQLVRSGQLGQVHAIDLTFHNAYGPGKPWFFDPAQSGGGCVMDLGVHLVDLALWTLGFPKVEDVEAQLFERGRRLATPPSQCEDYAVATLELETGAVVRLACSWNLHAGQDAVIEAAFYGRDGGAAMRNLGGSFYDFEAKRFTGTGQETLTAPPDQWGGRTAAAWARRLAAGERFDPEAERLVDVARVLDRIYGR
jgi:predicted dehydrogenase